MFNCIDSYSFIPVSCCVGRDTSALLCPVAYDASRTAVTIREANFEEKIYEFTTGSLHLAI